jgi:hypothetical protein
MLTKWMATIATSILLAPLAASADVQDDRAAFIDRMTAIGLVMGHSTSDGVVTLVVSSDFADSDFDSKEQVVGVVFRYHQELNQAVRSLDIIAWSSGAKVGTYDGTQLVLY